MRQSAQAALTAACILVLASGLGAAEARVMAPDRADQPGELTLARLEASIYSLPYVETLTDFRVEDDGVLVSPVVQPTLRFPWKVVDHSRGLNVTADLTVKVFRDEAFPTGEDEHWLEVETIRKRVTNHDETTTRGRFERQGSMDVRTALEYGDPIHRYKVVLQASVRSSLHASSATKERIFFLAMAPQWKGAVHQHRMLVKTMLLAFRRKQSSLRWRSYLAAASLANRSLRDARRFSDEEILSILRDSEAQSRRDPGDDELEEIAYDLMNESGRVMGRLTERLSAVNQKILGVTRLGFSNLEATQRALQQTSEQLTKVTYYRNLLVTFLNVEQAAELRERLDRILFFINEECRTLRFLWNQESSGDLAVFLGKLQKTLSLEAKEIAALARLLARVLGRNKKAQDGWGALFESRLYKELYPEDAQGNKDAVCQTLRTVFQTLYYHLVTHLYHVRIIEAAVETSLKPFQLDAPTVALRPPIEDESLPTDLNVMAPLTGQTIKPGDIAHYRITVRNLHHQPREVRWVEVRKLPSGWISKFTDTSVLLQPGEQKTVTYAVTAPYYTGQTMTARSSVRIFFAEDPGRFHEPVFQTRCLVGTDVVAGDPTAGPNHLSVAAPDSQRTIRPGAVATYEFVVRHDGPSRKLVNFDIVSEIPDNWVVDAEPKRMYLQPGLPQRVTVKVTAPLYLKKAQRVELVVGVGYADEFSSLERIRLQTLVTDLTVVQSKPVLNNDETRTYFTPRDQQSEIAVTARNIGNVDDTFDLFLSAPPKGWLVNLDTSTVALRAGDNPVSIPLRVRPAAAARAGAYEKVHVTAVSVTHPEIRTEADLVLTIVEDVQLEVEPVLRVYRVTPGDAVDVGLRVTNRAEAPMHVGFRTSLYNDRAAWLNLREPPTVIEPGASKLVSGRLRVPDDVPLGLTVPFAVSAVNDRGDEIGAVTFEVATCRRHAVDIVLDEDGVTRNPGLVTARLHVTNLGTVHDTVALLIRGGVRRWQATLSAERLSLAPGQTGQSRLIVKIPPRVSERKAVSVEIQAKSITDSSASDFVSVDVTP